MNIRQKVKACSLLLVITFMPVMSYALITTTPTQQAPCQFPPCGTQTQAGSLAPISGVTNLPSTIAVPVGTVGASAGPGPSPSAVVVTTPPSVVGSVPGSVGGAPAAVVVTPGVASPGVVVAPAGVVGTTQTTQVEERHVTTTNTNTNTQGAVAAEIIDNEPLRADPISYRQIRELMIYESNLNHGECACPYNPDRIGGQCGSESQYYKPHSDKIYCYYSDISNNDVHFYWLKHGIGLPEF